MNHSGEPCAIQVTAILVIGLPQIFTDIRRGPCFIRSVIQCLHAPPFDGAALLNATLPGRFALQARLLLKIGIPNVAVPDKDALDATCRVPCLLEDGQFVPIVFKVNGGICIHSKEGRVYGHLEGMQQRHAACMHFRDEFLKVTAAQTENG